jgi:hypothetical protein
MRASPRWILVVVALAALGVVAAALAGAWTSPPPPAPFEELPVAPPPAPPGEQPGGEAPLPELRVVVNVRQLEAYRPPPGEDFEVLVGAPAQLGAPLVGQLLVAFGPRGGARTIRAPFVEPGGAGPAAPQGPWPLRGRVLDADGKPVVGAAVWCGELDGQGDLVTIATGDDGEFATAVPAGPGVPVLARARGFASSHQVVEVGARTGEVVLRLVRAVSVHVQTAGIVATPTAGRVFVVPLEAVGAALSSYPFWLAGLRGGVPLDARGRATLDDLPADCEVGLVVVHPLAALAEPRVVRLRGRETTVVVPMRYEAERTVRVLAADDEPIAGARLVALPDARPWPPSVRLLPEWLRLRGAYVAHSDVAGSAAIAATTSRWRVEAFGFAGRDVAAADTVRLVRWGDGDPRLVVEPPGPTLGWLVECDLGGGVRAAVPPGGEWQVALPAPGRYEVALATSRGDVPVGEPRVETVEAVGLVRVTPPAP